jgi:hypothetical protein
MTTMTRQTLQQERRETFHLPPQEEHQAGTARRARVRALPPAERDALIAAAAKDGEDVRARVAQALVLPQLNGTPKQIAWAQQIRAARIDKALAMTMGLRDATVIYRLSAADDYLHVYMVPGIESGEYEDEAALLAALTLAVTHGQRTNASWWIDYLNNH